MANPLSRIKVVLDPYTVRLEPRVTDIVNDSELPQAVLDGVVGLEVERE